jgi:hypothetical protein
MSTSDHQQLVKDCSTFTVVLRAEPGVDAIKALRNFLKLALRRFRLRAIDVREDWSKP